MRFDPKAMGRGRGQVLYRYRPWQTFDHAGGFTAQVFAYGRDDTHDADRLDENSLIDEAMRFVERWRHEGRSAAGAAPNSDRAPGFPDPDPLARGHYEVVVPGRVLCRVWPLVVRCDRCRCVWEADDPVPGTEWPGHCPYCRSTDARQLQYLFVHPCGDVAAMAPPDRCRRCHFGRFRLNDRVSRFIDFRWECLRCSQPEPLQRICLNPRCLWTNKLMSPQLHTASAAYAGQGVTLVNVPDARHAQRRQTDRFVVGSIARWLNLCSQAEFEALLGADARTNGDGAADGGVPAEVLAAIRVLEEAGLHAQAEPLRRRFAPVDLERLRDAVRDELGFDPLVDRVRAAQLAAHLDEYQRVLGRSGGHLALSDVERMAASPGRATLYAEYRTAIARAGFDPDDLFLVTRFPVTRLAVGYTRGGFAPAEADLVPYRGRAARGQTERTLLYAHHTETEALLFRLDLARVERWLEVNNLVRPGEVRQAGGVQRWFARSLEGYDGQVPPALADAAGDDDAPLTALGAAARLFRLLHTTAHQVLHALAIDSGRQETGLSEYLFPYDLAFAVYPNGGSEFTIGGLRTVMEQALSDVLNRAMENATCLYDPNCLVANRGADHGCLFLPETSCTLWNRSLSRWELFGDADGRVTGYWDPRLADVAIALTA